MKCALVDIYYIYIPPKPELTVMKQDLRGQENWCIPAVQGSGQEICDSSNNRLQSHLHFLHSECSAGPYLKCVLVILSSQRLVVLEITIKSAIKSGIAGLWGNDHLLNLHTKQGELVYVLLDINNFTFVLVNLKCSFATAINICLRHFHISITFSVSR